LTTAGNYEKLLTILVIVLLQALLPHAVAFARPGRGIVVDKHGNVYTGVGVAKISADGVLTYLFYRQILQELQPSFFGVRFFIFRVPIA